MKRQYPFYVLRLELPPEIVDVNVHPNKLDVRFSNNQIIYSSVYSVVSKVLDGISDAITIIGNNNKNTNDNSSDYVSHNNITNKNFENKIKFAPIEFNDIILKDKTSNNNSVDIFAENKAFIEKLKSSENSFKNIQTTNENIQSNNTQSTELKIKQEVIEIKNNLSYVGQVLNTYLILEDGIDMYMVDQHAAHEKILFDKLYNIYNNGEIISQPLLIPYILNVNNAESNFLLEKINILNKIGVEISEFGKNAFKISSIPAFIASIDIQRFFDDILSDIDGFNSIFF